MKRFSSLIFLAFTLFSTTAVAHNVMGGVYADGYNIEGEAGFSNGTMAHAGTPVKVTDQSGNLLGKVLTDEHGYFVFKATQHIDYFFEVNMGAGHILKMQLPAEELPDALDSNAAQSLLTKASPKMTNQVVQVSGNDINRFALEKAIAKQIKPLRKEIQALKEKSGLRDILGGIGYIFGLLGLVAFLRERKQKGKS